MLKKTMKLFTSITMSLLLIGSITVTAAEQPQSTDDVNQIDEMKELESVSFESSTILFITTHKHSISWIRADTFAKYMGVGYTTTSHSTFTNNIQKGDFIGADFGNDGDWNHMGFVTDKETTMSNGYYDYKVAQHTSNYHEWTSSSNNGWDTIESDGGKYGRVRR